MMERHEALDAAWMILPFVKVAPLPDDEGSAEFIFWAPDDEGDYAANCAVGRRYADATIDYIKQTGHAPILQRIVAAMPRGQDLSGIENGFLTGLAMAL